MNPTLAPIVTRVSRWADVETEPTRDGVRFCVAGHELARLSESGSLVVPTPQAVRDQLLTDGFADGVSGRPDQVRYRVRSGADVAGAIRLLRVAYLSRLVPGGPYDPRDPRVALDDHLRRLGGSAELAALLIDARRTRGERPVRDARGDAVQRRPNPERGPLT